MDLSDRDAHDEAWLALPENAHGAERPDLAATDLSGGGPEYPFVVFATKTNKFWPGPTADNPTRGLQKAVCDFNNPFRGGDCTGLGHTATNSTVTQK